VLCTTTVSCIAPLDLLLRAIVTALPKSEDDAESLKNFIIFFASSPLHMQVAQRTNGKNDTNIATNSPVSEKLHELSISPLKIATKKM
jgi:hypothetical protein